MSSIIISKSHSAFESAAHKSAIHVGRSKFANKLVEGVKHIVGKAKLVDSIAAKSVGHHRDAKGYAAYTNALPKGGHRTAAKAIGAAAVAGVLTPSLIGGHIGHRIGDKLTANFKHIKVSGTGLPGKAGTESSVNDVAKGYGALGAGLVAHIKFGKHAAKHPIGAAAIGATYAGAAAAHYTHKHLKKRHANRLM